MGGIKSIIENNWNWAFIYVGDILCSYFCMNIIGYSPSKNYAKYIISAVFLISTGILSHVFYDPNSEFTLKRLPGLKININFVWLTLVGILSLLTILVSYEGKNKTFGAFIAHISFHIFGFQIALMLPFCAIPQEFYNRINEIFGNINNVDVFENVNGLLNFYDSIDAQAVFYNFSRNIWDACIF